MIDLLDKIHSTVFSNFKYKTDLEQFGVEEKWLMPDALYDGTTTVVGDCEDFALACRKLCRDNGIDNSRLVVCLTEDGEGHCVLEVNGWILDNRRRRVVTRDRLGSEGYKWLAVSGYNPGDDWHRIQL